MKIIDRKYKINAVSNNSGKIYTEKNSVLFIVSDALLPELLDKYHSMCLTNGVDVHQTDGIKLLHDRVVNWQKRNSKKVKLPDVSEGKEAKRICR